LNVSLSRFYKMRMGGKGPRGYKYGGILRFRKSQLDSWLENYREQDTTNSGHEDD
jgi:hypothetical protein